MAGSWVGDVGTGVPRYLIVFLRGVHVPQSSNVPRCGVFGCQKMARSCRVGWGFGTGVTAAPNCGHLEGWNGSACLPVDC